MQTNAFVWHKLFAFWLFFFVSTDDKHVPMTTVGYGMQTARVLDISYLAFGSDFGPDGMVTLN